MISKISGNRNSHEMGGGGASTPNLFRSFSLISAEMLEDFFEQVPTYFCKNEGMCEFSNEDVI